MGHPGNMLLSVQDRLIEMGGAPPLGHVEAESGRERFRRCAGHGVLPGAEGRQQVPVPVKGQVSMHHGGDAHGFGPQFSCIRLQCFHGRPEARPGFLQGIGPDAVFQSALPGVVPGGHGAESPVHQGGFDAGGAQLHAQHRILPFHHANPPFSAVLNMFIVPAAYPVCKPQV